MRFLTRSVAQQSLANPLGVPTIPPEIYIPLWWYSSAAANSDSGSSGASSTHLVAKGFTAANISSASSSTFLYTFNAKWPATTKFALEATIYVQSTQTVYAGLWDITANTLVAASQISNTTTTPTVVRSGQFTLTPGHVYGVALWTNNASYYVYITDISLVAYINAATLPLVADLVTTTLGNVGNSGQRITESQIPLWVSSSAGWSTNYTSAQLISKASTGFINPPAGVGVANKLHTLNPNWNPNQRFLLEASIYTDSNGTAYCSLYDLTSGAVPIAASQISTTSTNPVLIRSAPFTLTPGHSYGVAWWASSGYHAYITKAHLIPLLN